MSSLKDRKNFYKTLIVDDNLEIDYLAGVGIGFDEETDIPPVYTVTQSDLGRLDIISYKVYKSVSYWWLIAERNNIIDVELELYEGLELEIPSLIDFFTYYNKNIATQDPITETFASREL